MSEPDMYEIKDLLRGLERRLDVLESAVSSLERDVVKDEIPDLKEKVEKIEDALDALSRR